VSRPDEWHAPAAALAEAIVSMAQIAADVRRNDRMNERMANSVG